MTQNVKISDKLISRENNFNFLRLFAASLVVFNHCFPLTVAGYEPFSWLSGYDTSGGLAVDIFFVISGFLITKSWCDKPNLAYFTKNRFLRIMPAFIVAILFGMLIVGPLTTTLEIKDYLKNASTWIYLKNAFMYTIVYSLPGVFINNPYPNAVNGSIWTLPVETTMYIATAVFGLTRLMVKKSFYIVLVLAMIFIEQYVLKMGQYKNLVFAGMPVEQVFKFGVLFFIGALFFMFKEKIILNKYIFFSLFGIYIASFRSPYTAIVTYFTLPYIILYISYMEIPWMRKITKYGDFSYGIYVYSFPVQQTIIHFWKDIGKLPLFICSYAVTLVLSHFVMEIY